MFQTSKFVTQSDCKFKTFLCSRFQITKPKQSPKLKPETLNKLKDAASYEGTCIYKKEFSTNKKNFIPAANLYELKLRL